MGDPEGFVAIMRRLDIGLPREDELVATLKWLGRCRLVHRLDQLQSPDSRASYKIPDLLALFDVAGEVRPFLIEVKTTQREHRTLSWSRNYTEKLRRYSEQAGIPLLVAWKYRTADLWTLFDATHLTPNKGLTFENAMRQNLMCALAGDFFIVLEPGLGLHLVLEPVKFHGAGPGYATPTLLMPGQWTFKVHDAYFTNGSGDRVENMQPGLWPVLLTSAIEMESEFIDGKMRVSCVVKEDTPIHSAQRVLGSSVAQDLVEGQRPDWRRLILVGDFPLHSDSVREGMRLGFKNSTVRYILEQAPTEMPSFLANLA